MQFWDKLAARVAAGCQRGFISLGVMLIALPASAQVTDAQVGRVVEALRQASKPEKPVAGLYSDWQVKPENITRWSKACQGREISPAQFQANVDAARSIVTCVIRDQIKQEYQASGGNEAIAVQRIAAWWQTGDGSRYQSAELAPYVQRVVGFYSSNGEKATPNRSAGTFYDRYMNAGYEAAQRKDLQTALLYFRRALDERPEDRFALAAIQNLQASKR